MLIPFHGRCRKKQFLTESDMPSDHWQPSQQYSITVFTTAVVAKYSDKPQ
jgi:hypothetical protein